MMVGAGKGVPSALRILDPSTERRACSTHRTDSGFNDRRELAIILGAFGWTSNRGAEDIAVRRGGGAGPTRFRGVGICSTDTRCASLSLQVHALVTAIDVRSLGCGRRMHAGEENGTRRTWDGGLFTVSYVGGRVVEWWTIVQVCLRWIASNLDHQMGDRAER